MAWYPLLIQDSDGTGLIQHNSFNLQGASGKTGRTIRWTVDTHRETGCVVRAQIGATPLMAGGVTEEHCFTVGEFKRTDSFECGETTDSYYGSRQYITLEANVPGVEIIAHTLHSPSSAPYRKPERIVTRSSQSRWRRLMTHSDNIVIRPQHAPEILVTGATVTDANLDEVTAASETVSALLDVRRVTFRTVEPGVAAFIYTLDGTEPSATNGTRIEAVPEYEGDDETGAAQYTASYSKTYVELEETATVRVVSVKVYLSPVAVKTVEVRACLNLTIKHSTAMGWTDSFRLESTLANAPQLEYLWYSDAEGLVWKTLAANTSITVGSEAITQAMPLETTRFFSTHGVFVRAKAGSDNVFWTSANARAHWSNSITRAKGSIMSLTDPAWWTDTVHALTHTWQFAGLFEGCALMLGAAPRLEARTPTVGCYYRMFAGAGISNACLRLESLANDCATEMFQDCHMLQRLETCWAAWPAGATTDWVDGVAASGEWYDKTKQLEFFKTLPQFTTDSYVTWSTSQVPSGWSAYCSIANGMVIGGNCEAAPDGIEVD